MFDTSNPNKRSSNAIPWWVISIILLSITGVICYKVIITPFNLQFDFSSFLSLALALFSVALAAMFYFKATDTSNAFYDNTYKFTQEMAGVLVKIESGFGEKLTHLDDSYKGMRDQFYQLPDKLKILETKKEIEQEEDESKRILSEKEKMINDLATKAMLREEEKEKFIKELREKDNAFQKAQEEIKILKMRLEREASGYGIYGILNEDGEALLSSWTSEFINQLGGAEKVLNIKKNILQDAVKNTARSSDSMKIYMQKTGVVDKQCHVTPQGYDYILDVARAKLSDQHKM